MNAEVADSTPNDYVGLLRRRRIYLLTIFPAVALFAIFIAFVLPVSYQSTGTIMLEPSSIPKELVPTTVAGSAALTQYADQQVEIVRRKVLTKDSLLEIIAQVDPYPDLEDLTPEDKASLVQANTTVERVDPITLEPLDNSSAFSIHYNNPDPVLAAEVAKRVTELFVTYNKTVRSEQATATLTFLQDQSKDLEQSMMQMEQKVAQFKAQYGNSLPEAQTRNIAGADRAQRDVEGLQREIRLAEEQANLLELQLNDISPSLTAAVGDWRMELARLRGELALAEQRYTPEHPDVKRLRRAVADLAAQGGASTAASAVRPDNPEYLRIQSQLNGARRNLAALRANEARALGERNSFERNLSVTPNVEREYTQLARDYENAQSRYIDLQNKIKGASLAQSLESGTLGERFTLMRSPSVPHDPASPNRLAIILLGIVLGGAIAVGAAAMAEASDPTVRSSHDLQEIMNLAAVGSVPLLLNAADRRRRLVTLGSITATFVVATVIVALTVVNAS